MEMDNYLYDWTNEDFEERRKRNKEKKERKNNYNDYLKEIRISEDDENDFF